MSLKSYKDRQELRDQIQKLLKNYEGERIHIAPDILDLLLFERLDIAPTELDSGGMIEIFEKDKELERILEGRLGRKIHSKIIVWSGDFLSKLDLSEVSFEDVIWDLQYIKEAYNKDAKIYTPIDIPNMSININLSNTNARIDFSKSFFSKISGYVPITDCNFKNVDLSNNTIYGPKICRCDFENTGIKIKQTTNHDDEDFWICYSNMVGTNLSEFECSSYYMFYEDNYGGSTFTNTGIRITFDEKDQENEQITERLVREIKNGKLVGCYVNGVPIKSQEQRLEDAKRLKQELESDKYDAKSILSGIEEQISRRDK